MKTLRYGLALSLLVLIAAACAQNLDSLSPFPCAKDGTCPSGFQCASNKTCVHTASCRASDTTSCFGVCVDTRTDEQNCGECGTKCAEGAGCCHGGCQDLQADTKNCGACNNVCASGADCLSGACICRANATVCGAEGATRCVDLKTDVTNCGSCAHACKDNALCTKGTCVCPSGLPDECATECVDRMNDPQNCGGCGKACKTGAVCQAGACLCPPSRPDDCPTACVNKITDPENCGACGTSCSATSANVSCVTSACSRACKTGYTDCNGDLATGTKGNGCEAHFVDDLKNCGSCNNACTGNKVCSSSACQCPAAPGGGPCDVFPACGCTTSQNCSRSNGTGNAVAEHCVSAGASGPYASCSLDTECGVGYACVGNACKPHCGTSADCSGAYRACLTVVDTAGNAIAGVKVCSQHCNPLQPQSPDATHGACGAGSGCLPSGSTNGITDCVGGYGSGGQGAACTDANQCAVGYFCGFQPLRCVKYCRPGTTSDCLATYSCVSFSPKAYDGAQEIGVCNK